VKEKKFIFAGNRFFVLEELLKKNVAITKILALKGSYLERTLREKRIEFFTIDSKEELVSILASTDFDYFIANGCPFILPISKLRSPNKAFINIHPSPLPDLRGVDPIPGALLFGRNSGATCHVMDDGIDSGPIISRVVIPHTHELEAGLLYQMSFLAEKEVFNLAFDTEFHPDLENIKSSDCISYKTNPRDLVIDFQEPIGQTISRIKAFSNKSQGARFEFKDCVFRVFDAEEVTNPFMIEKIRQYQENEVVFNYETTLLLKHGNSFLKLKNIEGNLSQVKVGDVLGNSKIRILSEGDSEVD
jgi:methionyl-tRNA formyltransferase